MPRFISLTLLLLSLAPVSAAPPDFERQIAPLLSSHCLSCHSGAKPQGELDLTRKANVLNGEIVTPKKLEASELWSRVNADEMPPKKPLKAEEKALLRNWIESGAAWGDDPINPLKYTTSTRAGLNWWSLQPLQTPDAPKSAPHPIDAFLQAKRDAQQLPVNPAADRRTLIRRLSFSLTGLPPSWDEVQRFEQDRSSTAYTDLVDRLLASPHYGERWARHWLDVVRFGESQGFERNDPRRTAWPYRDWVIRSLNADMPYDQFAQLQIAGDVLRPNDPEAIKATGYLVAGIHNTVLPAQDAAKQSARQDELEDIVANIGQTFLGLSVQCARCHDHKFDPISQEDYYRLAASVSGVTHGERRLIQPELQAKIQSQREQLQQLDQQLQQLEAPTLQKLIAARTGQKSSRVPPTPLLSWDFTDPRTKDKIELVGPAKLTPGGLVLNGAGAFARSRPLERPLQEKTLEVWAKLANLDQRGGGLLTVQSRDGGLFDSIVFGEQSPRHWLAGSNFFQRTKPFEGPAESERGPLHLAITYQADGTITAYRQGQRYGQAYRSSGPIRFEAERSNVTFGIRHEPAGGNKHFVGTILRARIYDKALSVEEVAAAGEHTNLVTEAELVAELSARDRAKRQALLAERTKGEAERANLELAIDARVFAVVPMQPAPTRFLVRGQVTEPKQVIAPAGLQCWPERQSSRLTPTSPEAERRLWLANWLTQNPLFSRVIVNRVWHYHFGIGLVDTPSDFGFNGGRPTHPELLDYLAQRFRTDGYSLKKLHQLIVTSQAYQLASTRQPAALHRDAESRFLWRKRPQRLDAESLRDAMLLASGLLNRQVGGRGFVDYRIIENSGTTYYEPFDPVGAEFHRRSIYRFLPRSATPGLLEAFDCPDPAGSAPRRTSTTTPLQALALWNSDFALRMSQTLADRLDREAKSSNERVRLMYQLILQRQPTDTEQQRAQQLVNDHGLRALARALFNSNEFLTIE